MKFILICLCVCLFAEQVRAESDMASVQAMMILASNDPAPLDRRLEKVEFQLRRIFGFQYYRHFGEGAVL